MDVNDRRFSVLVVDDHEVTVELLGRLLRAGGYDVHTAVRCKDALRIGLQTPCDALVSDLMLPDGNGCDLLRALRAYRPTPAVAITGHLDPAVIRRAERCGFFRVLAKPIAFPALVEALDSVLRH